MYQCFGSVSGRIRIIWPDPDPYQETLIWIRVPKKNRDKLAYKSTKIIKIYLKKKEITNFVQYTRIISSKLQQKNIVTLYRKS